MRLVGVLGQKYLHQMSCVLMSGSGQRARISGFADVVDTRAVCTADLQ